MRQPAVRQLRRFRRPRRRLRAGLVQLLCVLAGLGLGLLLPRISAGSSVASTRVTEALVTIGFGTLGLVSVIFSLLFLVVQWAFGSLSPRLNLFRDNPVVWRTFGVALGVFVFSVTSALVIANDQQVSVVVPAVSSRRTPYDRPDAGPAGKSLHVHPAGPDAGGNRRGRPRHRRRPV